MTETFWRAIGGRKQFNGYVGVILATAMAFPLHASFEAYMGTVMVILLGTSGMVAYEDTKREPPTPSPEEPLPPVPEAP